jgi:hypothetical protein
MNHRPRYLTGLLLVLLTLHLGCAQSPSYRAGSWNPAAYNNYRIAPTTSSCCCCQVWEYALATLIGVAAIVAVIASNGNVGYSLSYGYRSPPGYGFYYYHH